MSDAIREISKAIQAFEVKESAPSIAGTFFSYCRFREKYIRICSFTEFILGIVFFYCCSHSDANTWIRYLEDLHKQAMFLDAEFDRRHIKRWILGSSFYSRKEQITIFYLGAASGIPWNYDIGNGSDQCVSFKLLILFQLSAGGLNLLNWRRIIKAINLDRNMR